MSDADCTGSRALSNVLGELDEQHIVLAVARASVRLRSSLARSGLPRRIGAGHFCPSVDAAVTALDLTVTGRG